MAAIFANERLPREPVFALIRQQVEEIQSGPRFDLVNGRQETCQLIHTFVHVRHAAPPGPRPPRTRQPILG